MKRNCDFVLVFCIIVYFSGCPQIVKTLMERKQEEIRKVYPGLICFKEGVRQIPIESIPGIRKFSLFLGASSRFSIPA